MTRQRNSKPPLPDGIQFQTFEYSIMLLMYFQLLFSGSSEFFSLSLSSDIYSSSLSFLNFSFFLLILYFFLSSLSFFIGFIPSPPSFFSRHFNFFNFLFRFFFYSFLHFESCPSFLLADFSRFTSFFS